MSEHTPTQDEEKIARKIVNGITDDLNDRSGFDLGALDAGTQREIKQTWTRIVRAALKKAKE